MGTAVLERAIQHSSLPLLGQNRAKRVDDSLAGDVGGGAMDWLVNSVALAVAVRDTAQRLAPGRRPMLPGMGNDTGFVADDVAEQVAGHDNAIQCARVLGEDHGRAVDELMLTKEKKPHKRNNGHYGPAEHSAFFIYF